MTFLHMVRLHVDTSFTTTLRNPIWLIFGFFQPVLWLVLFAPVFDRFGGAARLSGDALTILEPGLLMLLALYGSMFVGFGLLPEISGGMRERLNLAPAQGAALVLGRALRDLAVLLVQSTLLLVIAWPMGLRASTTSVLAAMGLVLAIGLLLTSGSNMLILLMKNENQLAATLNFVTLPLVLLSSIMLPLILAPGWIRVAAALNPLFYAIDALVVLSDFDYGFMGAAFFHGLVVAGALAVLTLGWVVHSFRRLAA